MKKLVLFAAALAALVACNKESGVSTDSFVKGQKLILNISAPSTTKVTSELNGNAVDFKWEANDVIKVTVNGTDAEFTLKSGAGESSASFEGEMPGSGSSFDVQYPYNAPTITSQTYSDSEAIPHDKMLFTATNCQVSAPQFTLAGQNALLRLNLWGTDKTISKIDVKNTTASGTITLNISGGIALPTTEAAAKAFFIVVPAGEYAFTAEIYDNAATPASICSFTPSAAQSFNNGQIRNMPAKEVKKAIPAGAVDLGLSLYWADHNIGADNPQNYGKYFAYGDITGQTWNSGWSDGGFANYRSYELDSNNNLKPAYDAAVQNWGDPWRMPTYAEFTELKNNCNATQTSLGGVSGVRFTSKKEGYTDKSIFIPYGGSSNSSGNSREEAGSEGYCWSSTFNSGTRANYFDVKTAGMYNIYSKLGMSVRPVCPKD